MTEKQKEIIKKLEYVNCWGSYRFTILVNECFKYDWICHAPDKKFWIPKEENLTLLGIQVFKRLHYFSAELKKKTSFELMFLIFKNIKKENELINLTEKQRFELKLQKAIKSENFERAKMIKIKLESL